MDPKFDGEPVQIYEPSKDDPIAPREVPTTNEDGNDEENLVDGENLLPSPEVILRKKTYIDGIEVEILAERVTYLDKHGRPTTESLHNFTRKSLRNRFDSLDDFLKRWKAVERKQAIIDEVESEGLPLAVIAKELGKDLDPFDLICHIAFDARPLTRRERAANVKKQDVFTKYGGPARAVLSTLLDKYANDGFLNLDDVDILRISPFNRLGTPVELIHAFGEKRDYQQAVHDLQSALYKKVA